MSRIQKVLLAIVYLICLILILYIFFNFFDFRQLNDYSYIKDRTEILINFKNKNFYLFVFLGIIFSIIWILLLGFATPLAIIAGFIFGKYVGTVISIFSFTVGCTLLYMFANFYFKDIVLKYLNKRLEKFKHFFKKNEFLYFMLFRFAGGVGLPFALQNVLPVLFDMKIKNYFYATLFGLVPTIFVLNSLGSGIENIVQKDINPSFFEIISDPNIYSPILGFLLILLLSYFIKKKLFKK